MTAPTETDELQRAETLGELWKRMWTAAPSNVRDNDGPFVDAMNDYLTWLTSGGVVGDFVRAFPGWIDSYNEWADYIGPLALDAGGEVIPKVKQAFQRAAEIVEDVVQTAAFGLGAGVVVLVALWLWSNSNRR